MTKHLPFTIDVIEGAEHWAKRFKLKSGEEALEKIKESPVDLVILDMIMDPGIDGLDTFKAILNIFPKQKAIITSGYSETNRVNEVLKLGVGQYVKKPFTMEEISGVVYQELKK